MLVFSSNVIPNIFEFFSHYFDGGVYNWKYYLLMYWVLIFYTVISLCAMMLLVYLSDKVCTLCGNFLRHIKEKLFTRASKKAGEVLVN